MNSEIASLVEMTRVLGQPQMNYVIIGEGNTSFRSASDRFWIKASGRGMNGITPEDFVEVHMTPILQLLDQSLTGDALGEAMQAARVNPTLNTRPSVEVTFHAALLHGCDVKFIGHTHPVAVNGILCGDRAAQFAYNRMFPDEIVLCGPRSVLVPYTDPGLPLALAIRAGAQEYMDEYGEAPKVILLQNHGMIALGQTPAEVLSITAMCVKAAAIFAGACAVGEPVFLSPEAILHIYRRPDEIYRRKLFVG